MGWLSRAELERMGFQALGEDVRISERASIHGAARIVLGTGARIDDFCVLSAGAGGITIGRNVHVAVYTALIGAGRIALDDFCNLSSRVSIYSSNDDYSGEAMTNPTVPPEFTKVTHADVVIGRHAIVGSGCVILPGAALEEGVAIGALSLVKGRCAAFGIYAGVPARKVGDRLRTLLALEKRFLSSSGH